MRKTIFHVLIMMLSLTFAGAAQADRSEGATTARHGVVRCGGTNFLRLSGGEIHTATYVLRNFDAINPIVIERIRFFDATGAVLFDTAGGPLPSSQNGVLGPANNTLNPNQTADFHSEDILAFLPLTDRPIQFELEWSARKAALSLDVVTTRRARQRDPSTGAVQAERSRSVIGCRSILLK